MNFIILFPYHRNMRDAYRAIARRHHIRFASRRISKLEPGITNVQPRVRHILGWRYYAPVALWQMLGKKTDVVVLKHIADPLNLVPYLICALKGIKVVVITQHTPIPWSGVVRWLLGHFLRWQRAAVLATTERGRIQGKQFGLRTVYSPACIVAREWAPRQLVAPSATVLNVLTVAKYQRRKNLVPLVQAIGLVQQRYSNLTINLTVAGARSERPAAQQAWREVQDTVDQLNLSSHVSLLVNQPSDAMPKLYHQADLFILAADREPLGYAVVEAMAGGLPIIVTSEVGAASYVAPGENGVVLRNSAPDTLAAALGEFLSTTQVAHDRLRAMGEISQALVAAQHTPDRFVKNLESLAL